MEGIKDFYRGDLIELAEKIMSAQGDADDTKAFSDVKVVYKILNGEDNGTFNPVEVDKRLRREYPSIEKLENLASQFPIRTGASGQIYDGLTLRLFGDIRGICWYVNAYGGTLCIGKDDKVNVVGTENERNLLERIPHKITDTIGIIADVSLMHKLEYGEKVFDEWI
jgi:hypothetical protein